MKRGKIAEEHGQLPLFAEEVPKWLIQDSGPALDKSINMPPRNDSYEDLDELGQFADWLKRKEE